MVLSYIAIVPLAVQLSCWASEMGFLALNCVREDMRKEHDINFEEMYEYVKRDTELDLIVGYNRRVGLREAIGRTRTFCAHGDTLMTNSTGINEPGPPTQEHVDPLIDIFYDIIVVLNEYKVILREAPA